MMPRMMSAKSNAEVTPSMFTPPYFFFGGGGQ